MISKYGLEMNRCLKFKNLKSSNINLKLSNLMNMKKCLKNQIKMTLNKSFIYSNKEYNKNIKKLYNLIISLLIKLNI